MLKPTTAPGSPIAMATTTGRVRFPRNSIGRKVPTPGTGLPHELCRNIAARGPTAGATTGKRSRAVAAWFPRRSRDRLDHPAESLAAEDMDMEMRHLLVGVRTVIGEDAIAALLQPEI